MRPVVICQSGVPGGAETYLIRLYRLLADRGMLPSLVGGIPGWVEAGLPAMDVNLGPKWSGANIFSGVGKLRWERQSVLDAVETNLGDFFHLQFKREQIGFTKMLASRGPVVWTEHGRFLGGVKGRLLAAGYRAAARHVSVIICVSDVVAKDVRKVVGPGPRIEVIHNAVDTQVFTPAGIDGRAEARRQLGIPVGQPVLLWIGRLNASKLPHQSIAIAKKWPGMVVIAGDGPERANLDVLAAGHDNIRFLGHVNDAKPAYAAADVMLFTSTGAGEGFPTTLVEAAAFGLPVLGNAESGFGKYIGAAGGTVLASHETVDAWVAAGLDLVANPAVNELARRWSEKYDTKQWADRHKEVFDSLL